MNLSRWTAVGAVVASAGCAPSLATMQPAHVAPKGHWQATAGFEVGVPTGTISTLIDTGKTLSDRARAQMNLTPQDERQLFDAGVTVVVSPLAVGYHFAGYYTPFDRFEVGLRYAGGGWRLGARYQLLRHETGPFDMTIGAGVARSAYEIPLSSYIPVLEVEDFTRWTVDVPLQIGTSREYFRVWAGPKFLYSHFSTAIRFSIPGGVAPDLATFDGHTLYYGGQGGIAVGYRHVFFAVELTLAGISGVADVQTAPDPRNGEAVVHDTHLSGFIVYPVVGLIGEF